MPGLCESIDYAEVQGVLFPRVAVSYLLDSVKHETSIVPGRFFKNPCLKRKNKYIRMLYGDGADAGPGTMPTLP